MKVKLINHTQNAKDILIFTKNTRLDMTSANMRGVKKLSEFEKNKQIEYISNTIKSSWEFIDFTFMIEGVSRGFTHQFVRNRLGSYAQQTMRILDMKEFEYITGPGVRTVNQANIYKGAMADIQKAYDALIEAGVPIEDARGILPTNISTNIVCKFNLRALSDMMASRASSRTQNEYREVIDAMYMEAVRAMPWLDAFLRPQKYHACSKLENIIRSHFEGTEVFTDYLKLIDQVRNS